MYQLTGGKSGYNGRGKFIRLKRPAVCHDCKTPLAVGTLARWYGPNAIYGINCHDNKNISVEVDPGNTPMIIEGEYSTDGFRLATPAQPIPLPAPKLMLSGPKRDEPKGKLMRLFDKLFPP